MEELYDEIYSEIVYSLLYHESINISHICSKIWDNKEVNDPVLHDIAEHMPIILYTERHPKCYKHACISMSHEQYV
jgi:hypothetical protein